MMLSDLIPVRKSLNVIRPIGDRIVHRKDSWWLFRGHVFGGKEVHLKSESAGFHEANCV